MVWQFLIVFYIDFYSKPRYLTEEPVVYIFKCFTLRPCGLSIPVTMYECLFCATRGLYLLTGLIFEGKDRGLQAQAQRTCAHKRIKTKSSTRRDSPARETQQTVKAHLHLWEVTEAVTHPHNDAATHTVGVFMETGRNIGSKGVHHLCVQGLNHFHTCTTTHCSSSPV